MITKLGRVIFGHDAEVAAWVSARIPGYVPMPGTKALGVQHKDKPDLAAGVAFDNYNGVHVVASIAVDHAGWATRETMFHIFNYPFNQLNCEAITVLVPSTNLKSINLAMKMGFEPEALLKFAAHDGSALIVMKLFRGNCRWIDNGQGRETSENT